MSEQTRQRAEAILDRLGASVEDFAALNEHTRSEVSEANAALLSTLKGVMPMVHRYTRLPDICACRFGPPGKCAPCKVRDQAEDIINMTEEKAHDRKEGRVSP